MLGTQSHTRIMPNFRGLCLLTLVVMYQYEAKSAIMGEFFSRNLKVDLKYYYLSNFFYSIEIDQAALENNNYNVDYHDEELELLLATSVPNDIGKPGYCKYCKFCKYW